MNSRKEQLIQMLEEQPGDTFVLYALGMEALADKDYAEALKRFREVIETEPSHHPAYYQLAKIYQVLDIIDVAKTYAEKGKQFALEQNNRKAAGEFEMLLEELE